MNFDFLYQGLPRAHGEAETGPILAVSGLKKQFAGLLALSDVAFEVGRGQVTSIIGPNGAGKTTLFNIMSGQFAPTAGSVRFRNLDVTGRAPDQLCHLGIARTFQDPRVFANLSCLENIIAARYTRTSATLFESVLGLPRARQERRDATELAEELLSQLGIEQARSKMPNELSFGNQRRLEIARALATAPEVLLMDEPSGGLTSQVIDQLLQIISDVVALGTSVLLVEHNMSVVASVSSRVIVLDLGMKIAEGEPRDILRSSVVRDAYLGTA